MCSGGECLCVLFVVSVCVCYLCCVVCVVLFVCVICVVDHVGDL